MINVSVIVPIYKVERFIARCARSLMEQTLPEVEYIFVDDASPDGSMKVLEEVLAQYPDRKEQVRIVHHEVNRGLPAARNAGLALAGGEYVFHCDSDDFVERDMLAELYHAARQEQADIVWCDWWLSFEKRERYMKQPEYDTPMEALQGMLRGAMKYNVWNKLVKRSLYTENDICFPNGYGMGEDMTMIRLMACARRVAYVPRAFYHYVKQNGEAFTNQCSERHLTDVRHNVDETVTFLEARYGAKLEQEVAWFKLSVKWPFLISDKRSMYRLWQEWYPEANRYIGQNRSVSHRCRWLQLAASKGWFGVVWLHYRCVYKLMYGIIYR